MGFYDNDVTDPGGNISSNIFANNSAYAIYCEASDHVPELVEYNLLFANGTFFNYGPVGLGVELTQNANGVSSDTYYNFQGSPDFFSTTASDLNFLYLKSTSAAIDAGNPIRSDPDGGKNN